MQNIIGKGHTIISGLVANYQSPFAQQLVFDEARGDATVIYLTDTQGEANAASTSFLRWSGRQKIIRGIVSALSGIRSYTNSETLFTDLSKQWQGELILVRDLGCTNPITPDDPWFKIANDMSQRDGIRVVTVLNLGPQSLRMCCAMRCRISTLAVAATTGAT